MMRNARKVLSANCSKSYSTAVSPSFNIDIQTLDYENVKRIKEERFGQQHEEYKRLFEEPLCEAYNTVNLVKTTYANRQAR
jgi:hypothetical protein